MEHRLPTSPATRSGDVITPQVIFLVSSEITVCLFHALKVMSLQAL